MLAVNYTAMSKNLKYYYDQVTDNCETVVVTGENEKTDGLESNIVLLSLEKYNSMLKIINNAEYLDKIDLSVYNKAMAEFNDNQITYSLDEIKKDLDL